MSGRGRSCIPVVGTILCGFVCGFLGFAAGFMAFLLVGSAVADQTPAAVVSEPLPLAQFREAIAQHGAARGALSAHVRTCAPRSDTAVSWEEFNHYLDGIQASRGDIQIFMANFEIAYQKASAVQCPALRDIKQRTTELDGRYRQTYLRVKELAWVPKATYTEGRKS
jgi:hypothetical protein